MMFSPKPGYLMDAGIPLLFMLPYSVVIFVIVVLIEARIMSRYFPLLSRRKRISYSLIINFISTILEVPFLFIGRAISGTGMIEVNFINVLYALTLSPISLLDVLENYLFLFYSFIITIIAEFGCLIFLLRPQPPIKEAVRYTIWANIVSYGVMLLTPIALYILLFIIMLFIPR